MYIYIIIQLYIYIYIYIYIHIYTYIYVCMIVCMIMCIYDYVYIYIHVWLNYMCVCTYTYMYNIIYLYMIIYIYVCMCIYIYIYIYIWLYVCVCACIYIYIYIIIYSVNISPLLQRKTLHHFFFSKCESVLISNLITKHTQIGKPQSKPPINKCLTFRKKQLDLVLLYLQPSCTGPSWFWIQHATPVGESERIHLSNQAAFCVEGVHVNRTLLKLKVRCLTK